MDGLDKALVAFRDEWKTATQPSLKHGVDLFKAGQYATARDVFAQLRESETADARVWYYSALANGFATGKWDGETERLAFQGVEHERAGVPKAADIDAEFADLPPTRGKNWLDFYRKRATGP